jgi:hypothetical protein
MVSMCVCRIIFFKLDIKSEHFENVFRLFIFSLEINLYLKCDKTRKNVGLNFKININPQKLILIH